MVLQAPAGQIARVLAALCESTKARQLSLLR